MRVLGAISVALLLFVFSVVVAGDSGWTAGEHIHVVAAVLMGLVLLVGIGGLVFRPGDRSALATGGVAVLAILLVQAVVGDPDNHGGQAGPYDPTYIILAIPYGVTALLALRLAARSSGSGAVLDRAMFLLGLVALAAALPYAIDEALMQRNSWPPASDPHHNSHWATMAQVAVIPGLLLLLAASRAVGSVAQEVLAALTTVVLGLTSISYPDDPSSLGLPGGVAAAVLGVAIAVVSLRGPRQRRRLAA